jgi:hypothetical protein
MTKQLISPREAGEQIGVSLTTIKAWMRRAENPLPHIQVGSTGRVHKIVVAEINGWLTAEAARKTGTVQ